jgi:hypothetical protein
VSFLAGVCAVTAAIALIPKTAAADTDSTPGNEMHVRMGMLSGNYSQAADNINDSFSVSNSLDAELEHFTSTRGSWILRTMFAYDLGKAQMMYAYTGIGKRWYFWSDGMEFGASNGSESISTSVRRRYYVTAEGGLAEVLVKTIGQGNLLAIPTADYEFGANFGVIQQMSRNWGLEAQLGYALGFGFSSVAVGGSILSFLLGVAVYF